MDRDNLQAKLQDIPKLSVEKRVEAYEDLFDRVDVNAVEKFQHKNGGETVVLEVKRRVWLLHRLAKQLGLEKIERRSENLLKQFD